MAPEMFRLRWGKGIEEGKINEMQDSFTIRVHAYTARRVRGLWLRLWLRGSWFSAAWTPFGRFRLLLG